MNHMQEQRNTKKKSYIIFFISRGHFIHMCGSKEEKETVIDWIFIFKSHNLAGDTRPTGRINYYIFLEKKKTRKLNDTTVTIAIQINHNPNYYVSKVICLLGSILTFVDGVFFCLGSISITHKQVGNNSKLRK